jgi:hypothetical protein
MGFDMRDALAVMMADRSVESRGPGEKVGGGGTAMIEKLAKT